MDEPLDLTSGVWRLDQEVTIPSDFAGVQAPDGIEAE
jgi:hypothetical protein